MQFWFIMSLVFAVLIAFFAVLNSDVVTIRLFFKEVELSQSVIILGSAAIGAIVATFIGIFNRLKSSLKIRELKNQIRELEGNLAKTKTETANKITSEKKPEPKENEDIKNIDIKQENTNT